MNERGFTLMEVLVALAILVISMGLLFQLIGTGLDRSRAASRETEAVALLQSLLADPDPRAGAGQSAGGFAWAVSIAPHGGERPGWAVDGEDVSATVSWQEVGRREARTLSTLRIVPKPVAP